MSLFAKLLNDCLQEPKTNRTIAMIEDYLKVEDPVNLPFALHFLLGNHLGRFCSGKHLLHPNPLLCIIQALNHAVVTLHAFLRFLFRDVTRKFVSALFNGFPSM